MRKTLRLILALLLAFSLAAVPAFAADTTEAETSTSDTAYANGWVGGMRMARSTRTRPSRAPRR